MMRLAQVIIDCVVFIDTTMIVLLVLVVGRFLSMFRGKAPTPDEIRDAASHTAGAIRTATSLSHFTVPEDEDHS